MALRSVQDYILQVWRAIKDFGLARLAATQFASRFQAMGSTMGITAEKVVKANEFITNRISKNTNAYKELGNSVSDMSINLTKLTADMASLYNQDYADVAQDMQAIFTGMTRPLRKYGLDLTNATLKEWAMSQGLDSNIEKMSQAEKTMLRYQYVMTRTTGAMGDFQKTADTWANAMRTVKQLLQEIARLIGEALINALRPALLAFRDFLFKFLNMTQSALNALGKLLGWKQITFGAASLVDDTEDYADALDDAAGAAKKLKGQLRGIDELNNLTTNNKGGSGAGGLGGIGAQLEELVDEIGEEEKPYESAIKNWYEFGTKISYALRDGLQSINWETIYGKASNFGHNLAEFLNGIIRPDTFYEVGKTIAGALMTAINFAFEFGDTFDFIKLGNSIANGIVGFFDEFDGAKFANTIDLWVQGLWNALKTAITQIFGNEENRKKIFDGVKEFFLNLDDKTVNILVGAGTVIAGVGALVALVAAAFASNPIVVPVTALVAGISYMGGRGIDKLLTDKLGTNEKSGESRYSEMWAEYFGFWDDAAHLKDIGKGDRKPKNYINKLAYASGRSTAGLIMGRSAKELEEDFLSTMDIGKDDGKKWWQNPLEAGMNALFSGKTLKLIEAHTFLIVGLRKDIEKLKNIIKETWDTIIGWFDYFDKKTDPIKEFFSKVIDKVNSLGDSFDNLVGKIFGPAEEKISGWLDGLFNNSLDFENKAFEWAASVKDRILEGMTIDEILLEDTLGKIIPFIEEKATQLGTWIQEKKEEISGGIKTWFEEDIIPWFAPEKWKEILQPIRDQLKYAFQAGANSAVGALNKVLGGIEKMVNGASDIINLLIEVASKISGKDISKLSKISIPRIAIPYANGGYPQVGSLFLAGEAGSEMVGTINGRTGVVSNGEITGIADAIRSTSDTEIQLLRQQNTLLQGILNKEFGISSDSIFNSVRSSARDFTNRTGDPAFI